MYSNDNKYCEQDLNYLYQNIKHERNICSLFPTTHEYRHPIGYYHWVSMINIFDEHENDTLKMFCMIFNGVANIFLNKWYRRDYRTLIKISGGYGFDAFVYHNSGLTLRELLKEYIINHIAHTGLFDTQKNRFFSSFSYYSDNEITTEEIKQFQVSNDEILLSIKKSLFSNDKEFSEFVEYCIKDIKSDKTNKFKSIRKIIANDCDECDYRCGISYFIINRLSYLLFIELMKYERNNKNTKELLFPSLIKFYKFMYNLSIYIHCYRGDDVFLIREYSNLTKYKWYSINIGDKTDMQLKHIHYFDGNTLLHGSIEGGYNYYCKLLIRDNFNCMHKNDRGETAFDCAQTSRNAFVLELMNGSVERNLDQNGRSEFSSEMDDKSIELRYNSFMNQNSFSKYFLQKIGVENEKETDDEYIIAQAHKTDHEGKDDYDPADEHNYDSEFYVSLKDLVGLKKSDGYNNINDGSRIMKYIVNTVISLLKLKVVVSDDLIVLCTIYDCNTMSSVLIDVIKECLLSDNVRPNEEFATRNYVWFKHYLLDSNVWFVKYKSKTILFDELLNVIQPGLIKQKKFIWDHFAMAKKDNTKLFNQLCMFGIKNDDSNTTRLRQDKIANGIIPERSELSMLLLEAQVGNNSKVCTR